MCLQNLQNRQWTKNITGICKIMISSFMIEISVWSEFNCHFVFQIPQYKVLHPPTKMETSPGKWDSMCPLNIKDSIVMVPIKHVTSCFAFVMEVFTSTNQYFWLFIAHVYLFYLKIYVCFVKVFKLYLFWNVLFYVQ